MVRPEILEADYFFAGRVSKFREADYIFFRTLYAAFALVLTVTTKSSLFFARSGITVSMNSAGPGASTTAIIFFFFCIKFILTYRIKERRNLDDLSITWKPGFQVIVFLDMRKVKFANGEFYHVFNRGVDKRPIFERPQDFDRFLQSMEEFNTTQSIGSIYENSFLKPEIKLKRRKAKLVNIICYCLNINHYHFILEQLVNEGISKFMKSLGGGFTKYFNAQNKRNGVLFQGQFKARHIDSNEYLLHVSAYINLNNLVHKHGSNKFRSSRDEYFNNSTKKLCEPKIILDQYKNRNEYKGFANSSLKDILARKALAKELEHLLLE